MKRAERANRRPGNRVKAAAKKAVNKVRNKLAAASRPANGKKDDSELNQGRNELRRGNLTRAERHLEKARGTQDGPQANAYLGVLKGGLGYLRRRQDRPLWPTSAEEDFSQSLQGLAPDSPLWRAFTEAQRAEARRVHLGSRFAVISEAEFQEETRLATEGFDQALAQLEGDKGPKSRTMRGWILAHRGAVSVLACMRHFGENTLTASPRALPEAQRYFTQAEKDFTEARKLTQVYPWVSMFHAFLVSMRPRVFPDSNESTAQAAARSRKGFEEALSQSSDPRQRLQDVPEQLRGKVSAQKQARKQLESTLESIGVVQQALKQSLRALDGGQPAKAADRVEHLLTHELSGSHSFVFRCLAGMAYYAEQYDDAIRYGTLALQADPFDGVTRYFVASSLLDQGNSLGEPVGQSMLQELHNQLEVLLGMSLHLAVRTGPTIDLKERLREAGQGLVEVARELLPSKNDPAADEALRALDALMSQVRPPQNGPPSDEQLQEGAMKLLDALHARGGERKRKHFETILFKNLKK